MIKTLTPLKSRGKARYIVGQGHINWSKEKYYLQNYLNRVTISEKEYQKFRRLLVKLNNVHNKILNHKSVVEKILLKYNSPCT